MKASQLIEYLQRCPLDTEVKILHMYLDGYTTRGKFIPLSGVAKELLPENPTEYMAEIYLGIED